MKLSSKLLSSSYQDQIIVVDVMSHWDDDFAIDLDVARRWERRKIMMRTIQ